MPLVGLRERKKAETRQAISDAALKLAVAHGPSAVTVEDIAAAANVSSRTVFNYFPTKEAAILGIDLERRSELLQCLQSRPLGEPPLLAIREAFRELFTPQLALDARVRAGLARAHPQLQSTYVASFSSFEEELTSVVARRIGLDPAKDPYPRLVVSIALTAVRVAVNFNIDLRRTMTMNDVIDDVFAAIGAGLQPPERADRPARGRARRPGPS